jgi:hypothetical protein
VAEISTTTLGDLLKRLYAPWEIEQLVNLTHPVLAQCASEGSASLGGEGFYFPVRTKSAEGHAYINQDQNLPAGRYSTVVQAKVQPTVFAGVVQLTGLSMAVSSQDSMAFAEAFDENVGQTLEAMNAYKEGVLFRDGTGQLATFVDNPGGGSAGPYTLSDVGFLREGMYVDLVDTDLTTHHVSGVEIKVVDWPNKQVTFGSNIAAGVDAGDFLFMAGSQESAVLATSKEPIGLEGALLATGNYLNISRTDHSNWRANTMTASGFFDENIILRARTRLTQRSGVQLSGIRSMKWLTHPMQVDILFKLAIPRIQYSGNSVFDLGNGENVKFGGSEFITSYLAKPSVAYLGEWRWNQTLFTPGGKLHIDTQFNGSALKWVANRDAGIVFAKEYAAFANKRPNYFVRVSALTEATR